MTMRRWRDRRTIRKVAFIVVLCSLVVVSLVSGTGEFGRQIPVAHAASLSQLHTSGRYIENASGAKVKLVGVNRFSLEFLCSGDGHFTSSDFSAMASVWHVNLVRIPLSEVFWLNEGGPNCLGSQYQTTVANAVSAAEAAGLYVELELHRVEPFLNQSCASAETVSGGAEYNLPDSASASFWQQVAKAYASNTGVLFGLYNEPNSLPLGSPGWQIWQQGGTVTSPSNVNQVACTNMTYTAVGMNPLIANDIHPNAPNVPVIASGAFEFASRVDCVQPEVDNNGCGSQSFALSGQASVIYNVHAYSDSDKLPAHFNDNFGYTANIYPVIADEFGESNNHGAAPECPYVYDVMRYFDSLDTGYAAWVWTTDTGQLQALLSNWNGTASSYGLPIQDYFLGTPQSSCLAADKKPTITWTGGESVTPTNPGVGAEITMDVNFQASNDHAVYVGYKITDKTTSTVCTTPHWNDLYTTTTSQTFQRKHLLKESCFVSGHTYTVQFIVKQPNNGTLISTDPTTVSFTVS